MLAKLVDMVHTGRAYQLANDVAAFLLRGIMAVSEKALLAWLVNVLVVVRMHAELFGSSVVRRRMVHFVAGSQRSNPIGVQ